MTARDLFRTAEALEQRLENASGSARLALQPEFRKVLERLEAEGERVPDRLRRLEAMLNDEATEAWFDNMPV